MFTQKTLKLQERHGWKAKPGYAICVLDRGAVRFDFPAKWIVKQNPDCVKIHDREPPGDNCVLGVSCIHMPPTDWSGLPLRDLIMGVSSDDDMEIIGKSEVFVSKPEDLQLAWMEVRYIDDEEKREALSRVCIARGVRLHCLITFNLWAAHRKRFDAAWKNVLDSLVLEVYVDDPARGPVTH